MDTISIFTYKGTEVSILVKGKSIGYTFEVDGKSYGSKITLESNKKVDIVNAVFLLLLNFTETLEEITSKNEL